MLGGWRVGAAPVADSPELRCHEVVQEMLESGDWLIPRRGGEPWINKPPLFYWLAAGMARILGHYDEGVLRLPSMIASTLTVLLTVLWGRAVGGPRLGLAAGLLVAAMAGFQNLSRDGTAEPTLALATVLTLALFDGVVNDGRARWRPWLAAAFTFAVLAKATTPLATVGVPAIVWLVMRRRLRASLRPGVLASIAACLAVGFAWYGVILARVPGAASILLSEAVLPVGVRVEGHRSAGHFHELYYYLWNVPEIAMPVALLLPLLVWRALSTRLWKAWPRMRYVAVVLIAQFLLLTAIPQKQHHYALPMLPLLAILLADTAGAVPAAGARVITFTRRYLGVLAALLGGVIVLVTTYWLAVPLDLATAAWVAVAAAGLAAVVACVRLAWQGRLARFAVVALVGWCAFRLVYMDSIDVWMRQFKVGTMILRPDFDREHWLAIREEHEVLRRRFEVQPSWARRHEATIGAERMPELQPFLEPGKD